MSVLVVLVRLYLLKSQTMIDRDYFNVCLRSNRNYLLVIPLAWSEFCISRAPNCKSHVRDIPVSVKDRAIRTEAIEAICTFSCGRCTCWRASSCPPPSNLLGHRLRRRSVSVKENGASAAGGRHYYASLRRVSKKGWRVARQRAR